jgi:hypothetical protein
VLGVLGIIAIAGSTLMRQAREAREAKYAGAVRDSARRADSLSKLAQARLDSSGQLIGSMVDTAKRADSLRRDSIANANRALQNAVVGSVRNYAKALQSGDKAAARAVFPNATDRDLNTWDAARDKYDLKFSVESPSRVRLQMNNLVADLDFMLQVQYIDRATRSVYNTNRLPRHALLTRQGQRWQIDKLSER